MDIESFDSLHDMQRRLAEHMRAADARVQPWQAAIKAGEYFRHASGYGFNIYGEVLAEDEPREEHVRHYRFCKRYSEACVEGEFGDVHVNVIEALLSYQEFEAARQQGWRP